MAGTLGVIGGSGIYGLEDLAEVEERTLDTAYGVPSSPVRVGRLGSTRLLFIARHGVRHEIPPHVVNYRANVCALKELGAEMVVGLSAVGSLTEAVTPGDVVVIDQYIDLTRRRVSTFFDADVVAHVGFAEPVCPILAEALALAAERAGGQVRRGGTYVCIEGPQFSTRAESVLYRSFGASVIGMSALPEAKLAREAELPYATLALATDYDAWRSDTEAVSVEAVLAVLKDNAALAQRAVSELARALPDVAASPALSALKGAIITHGAATPAGQLLPSWLRRTVHT